MKMQFGAEENRVLHGLLEEASDDIVIRVDEAGFLVHASDNVSQLGLDFESLLLMPHMLDLVATSHSAELSQYVHDVLEGRQKGGWIEIPLRASETEEGEPPRPCEQDGGNNWYALSLRRIAPDDNSPQGALGLLRSVGHKHALFGQADARASADPLSGLAKRPVYCANLEHAMQTEHHCVAVVFAIDRLQAIFMQYGQLTVDEIQWGFAKFLDAMTIPVHGLAQLDAERFGVLLRGTQMKEARAWTDDILKTFAELTVGGTSRTPELSASAGLARLEVSVDWTLRQAELGLVMARAGGGMQAGVCSQPAVPLTSSHALKLSIVEGLEQAMQRTSRHRH